MAGSVSKTILVGNVGQDPKISRTQEGKAVSNFSIATSDSWRNKSTGQREERTTWHNIVCFNDGLNKVIEQYVKKGSTLYIEGTIQHRQYEKDGQTHKVSEIVLQPYTGVLTMLGSKSQGESGNTSQGQYGGYGGEPQGSAGGGFGGQGDLDSEIPFMVPWK